jgi:hypothetical protein
LVGEFWEDRKGKRKKEVRLRFSSVGENGEDEKRHVMVIST